MPRVILAHWHNGQAPGSELDVTEQELKDLRRDGRIADVLDGPGAQPEPSTPEPPAEGAEPLAPDPAPEEAELAGEPTKPSRRRR